MLKIFEIYNFSRDTAKTVKVYRYLQVIILLYEIALVNRVVE
jgi:hypothetical protein